MRMHGWRGHVVTKRPREEAPTGNLTPAVRGSQEFVLGAGDDDVIGGVGFAVGAEGAKGITVLLAIILIRTLPGIHTDYTGQIFRAEVVDQY